MIDNQQYKKYIKLNIVKTINFNDFVIIFVLAIIKAVAFYIVNIFESITS